MIHDPTWTAALPACWHSGQAGKSLSRWQALCEQNDWGEVPGDLALLARVFGASWYFTRFIFYRGLKAAALVDAQQGQEVTAEHIRAALRLDLSDDSEAGIRQLALVKNEWMLRILLCYLGRQTDLQQTEALLTVLAESVFLVFFQHLTRQIAPQQTALAILAMGRMSGHEMTFGSDLDLIFLYQDPRAADNSLLSRQIQKVLRYLGSITPLGVLYEVDMRLRPHGTAGALVTSVQSFTDYHAKERDIWERQLMTRCRIIHDPEGFAAAALKEVNSHVYQHYDQQVLRHEIVSMRRKVEQELGRPRDKYEIKRGRGGLMDIDFLCHYFQLSCGHQAASNRTNSTRTAIRLAGAAGFLSTAQANGLAAAYHYFKTIETALRLWDLKAMDSFSSQHERNAHLAVACGFAAGQTEMFMAQYLGQTDTVRGIFEAKLAPL